MASDRSCLDDMDKRFNELVDRDAIKERLHLLFLVWISV